MFKSLRQWSHVDLAHPPAFLINIILYVLYYYNK